MAFPVQFANLTNATGAQLDGNFDALSATTGAALIGVTATTNNSATTLQGQLNNIGSASGSTNIGFTQSATGAISTTSQSKLQEIVSAFDFMTAAQIADIRAGTLTIDVTIPLQTALTWATTNSRRVILPDGFYKITSSLTIPLNANGFGFIGTSLKGTVIRQDTNNTSLFSFPGGNNSNFEFGLFTLTYTNIQTSTNTGARAIDFTVTSNGTNAGFGIYNSNFLPLRIVNSCRGLYAGNTSDGDAFTTTTWGLKFGLLIFEGLSGSHIRFRGSSPNNRIEGPIYSVGSTSGTEELLYFQNQDNLYVGNYEVNNNFNGRPALRLDQTRGEVRMFRQEIATYAAANSSLINHSNAWIVFSAIEMLTTTFNMGVGNRFYVFNNNSSSGEISVNNFNCAGSTLTSGIPTMVWTNFSPTNRLTFRSAPSLDVLKLSDVGFTTSASGLYVESWNYPIASADNGDTSPVLTESSEMVQQFSTVFTANRTVTLPNELGVSNLSNLFNGKKFQILRNAATPDQFTLTVQANGILYVMPTNRLVEFTYKRAAWIKTNEIILPFANSANLTAVTSINDTVTYTTGGVTLASQVAAAGSAWRLRAFGTFVAANSATARNAQVAPYWGATVLPAITVPVLASVGQTTEWEVEFILSGSSATAIWTVGNLKNKLNSPAIVPGTSSFMEMDNVTPATTAVTAGAQTIDLRFSMSVAVATDIWNIHGVTMERLA